MRRRKNIKKPSLRSQHATRPLNIRMHCNVLWRASQKCLNKYGKPLGTWRITFLKTEKNYKQSTLDTFFKKQ
jgi:hypothetical protein